MIEKANKAEMLEKEIALEQERIALFK